MKTYKAFVTDKRADKSFIFNSREFGGYSSKKKFIADLHANGYTVHRCEVEEVYDYVLNNTNCENVDYEAARIAYREGKLDGLSRAEFRDFKDRANELFDARWEARIARIEAKIAAWRA